VLAEKFHFKAQRLRASARKSPAGLFRLTTRHSQLFFPFKPFTPSHPPHKAASRRTASGLRIAEYDSTELVEVRSSPSDRTASGLRIAEYRSSPPAGRPPALSYAVYRSSPPAGRPPALSYAVYRSSPPAAGPHLATAIDQHAVAITK
jgi:hypothetical protein